MLFDLSYINDVGEMIKFGIEDQRFRDTLPQTEKTIENPFVLIKFEGFGEVGANVQLQKAPFQDGSTQIDTLLDEKHPYLEFVIRAGDYIQLSSYRRKIGKVFNPKVNGRFVLSYGDKSYIISAIPEHVPNFADESSDGKNQVVALNLICPNPYWQSPSITEEPAFEPLFEFPFEGEFEMGIQRDQRIIINDGNAPAPILVEFFGPALNPVIINNTTGEFIKINQQLEENERMIVDTSDENKSVYFVDADGNERNVFNWIDLDSTFFKLQIGENDIEYTADNDVQGAIVNISYSKLYTAV